MWVEISLDGHDICHEKGDGFPLGSPTSTPVQNAALVNRIGKYNYVLII